MKTIYINIIVFQTPVLVVKLVNKNSEGTITGTDIHGRLEALDQSVRSVDGRLRAVERRLSYNSFNSKNAEQGASQDYDIIDEIEELSGKISILAKSMEEMRNEEKSNAMGEIKSQVDSMHAGMAGLTETTRNLDHNLKMLSDTESRLERLENANKITIGKIKVPIELSGLIAAFVLLATGFLIFADKWNIIRSSYYPITIGILFGAVVIAKFLITNKG